MILPLAFAAALAAPQQLTLLASVDNPGPQGLFGYLTLETQDLDGDGRRDFGVTSSISGQGRFQIFSSADLSPLLDVQSDRLGTFCRPIGDVTGDGVGELLARVVQSGVGYLSIVDPTNGSTVATVNALHSSLGSTNSFTPHTVPFGPAPDVDGDGRRDFWVQSKSSGSNAANYFEIRSAAAPDQALVVASGRSLFSSVDILDDLTGDGIEEFVVGDRTFESGPGGTVRGQVRVISGVDASTLFTIPGDATTHSFGEYVRNVGDVTGDGFPDFAASWSNNSIATKMVTVYSGSTGELIHTLAGPSGAFGSSFGDVLAGAGDIDGDGHEDIGLGVPDESKAYVFSGATGIVLAVTEGQHSMGRSIRGIGDFNGDGRDDWVVGSPGGPQPSGRFEVYGLVGEEIILDFERSDDQVTELPNGAALEDAFGNLIRVSSSGQGQVGPATFDSSVNGPNAGGPDPDLLVGRGNLLILQENAGQSTPGIYDVPDDSRMGGSLFIELLEPMEPLSLVLVDICPGPAKQRARVRLIDSARRSRTFTIPDGFTADGELAPRLGARTLELNTLLAQPGYKATATATEDPGFDPASTMMIIIELSGSGGVDDVRLRRP